MKNESLGRAAYEAFMKTMAAWLPYPRDWNGQAATVKQAWIDAAMAARASS